MDRYEKLMEYIENKDLVVFFEEYFPSLADILFMYYKVEEYKVLSSKINKKYSDLQQNSSELTIEDIMSNLDLTEEIVEKIDIKKHENFYCLESFEKIKLANKSELILRLFVTLELIVDFLKKFQISPTDETSYKSGLISLHCWSDLFGDCFISDLRENVDEALPIYAILKLLYLGVIPANFLSNNLDTLVKQKKDLPAKCLPRIPLLILYNNHKIDIFLTLYLIKRCTRFMELSETHSWNGDFKFVISDYWGDFAPKNIKVNNTEDFQDYFALSTSEQGWKVKFFELPTEDKKFAIKVSAAENDFSSEHFVINVYYKIIRHNAVSCYAQVRSTKKVFAIQKNQLRLFSDTEYYYKTKDAIYILESILSFNENNYILNPELWFDMNPTTENFINFILMELLIKNNFEIPIHILEHCCLHFSDNKIKFRYNKCSKISRQYFFSIWYENIIDLQKRLKLCSKSDISINLGEDNPIDDCNYKLEFDKKWEVAKYKSNDKRKVHLFYKIQEWFIFENSTNKDVLRKIEKEFPDEYSSLIMNERNQNKEISPGTLTKKLSALVTESRDFAKNNKLPYKSQKSGKKKSPLK